VIGEFVKVLFAMWGDELEARDEDVKTSMKGKQKSNTYSQTK
jgi:hypothetical protein